MSSLSGGTKEANASYIKIILYQSQLCENSLNAKNLFPYSISIQFDNNPEKCIEPIKNVNEIFNTSLNEFKYLINNNNQKHLIKINCFSKSVLAIKKKFASSKIAINAGNLNKNRKENNVKKWYYLKNKKGEIILKLLLSIDIINISKISIQSNKTYFPNENEYESNLSINKPNNLSIHFNSISNNNLNGIASSTYMSTSHYISSSNNSLKSSSARTNNSYLSNSIIPNQNNYLINRTISNNNLNNNLLSSIIEKDDSMTIYENDIGEKFGELNSNILLNIIQNIFKKNNQKLFIKSKNLIKNKQNLGKEENNYFKNRKLFDERKLNLKKDIKTIDKKRQLYENKFLDLTENFNNLKHKIYKSNIKSELNSYENEVISNINNIFLYQINLDEKIIEEKMTKNYFSQHSMNKTLKENEKSVINNYYNNKGYSFESNNYKSSLYLYGNGGNSNKLLFNVVLDNKSIYNNNINNNNFNIRPSPISYKYKKLDKELSVSISNSNSSSSEKNKKRLITDYSKSTFNIIDDLYIFDEIPDIDRNKASKSNNIVQNNLALNLDDLQNINISHINKFRKKDKKNNKVIENNNKKNNYYNLVTSKKNKKKVKINDDENNSYYHLDNKYYSITILNNRNKESQYINKKIFPKKLDSNIDKKDFDLKKYSEKSANLNNDINTKKSYKSIIFKQKIDNNNSIIHNNNKNERKNINNKNTLQNTLQSNKKKEPKNNTYLFNENINNKKNNRVFTNIFASKTKDIPKKEKINSIITENTDNKSNNNSLLVINSILPDKLISIENNSRNIKNIQYNTNSNKNIKYKKINRNCIKLHKKCDNDNLINYFCYNNDANSKTKYLNKKISFYINDNNKNTIGGCSTKIITKKNTDVNTFNKINNTIDYNIKYKKVNNNKIYITNKNNSKNINRLVQNKKINAKKNSNIDSNISFYIRKNKTLNDEYNNNRYNLKSNNKLINKNKNDDITNTIKKNNVKNQIIKIQKRINNPYQYTCIINNSFFQPLTHSNKNKTSILSLFNNRYN